MAAAQFAYPKQKKEKGGPSMQTISVRRTLAQLARQPLYWAGLAALLALGYAYAMGTSAVGVDDLAIATYQQGGGFLRQSRITEWLVQALTGLLAYQRFWPEFWAAVCLALAGTGLAAVVYTAAARTPTAGGALLLAGGGLLFPFHAEAFAYSNLCITGLGMLLAVAALAAGWPFVAGGRRTAAAPAACVLLALSVGCYESLAQVWLALLFVLLLTLAAFAPRRSVGAFWWLPAALRGALLLAAALAVRGALAGALRLALGVTGAPLRARSTGANAAGCCPRCRSLCGSFWAATARWRWPSRPLRCWTWPARRSSSGRRCAATATAAAFWRPR